MGFEDYMIDDGFSDGQEYMNYLEREALEDYGYQDYDYYDNNYHEGEEDEDIEDFNNNEESDNSASQNFTQKTEDELIKQDNVDSSEELTKQQQNYLKWMQTPEWIIMWKRFPKDTLIVAHEFFPKTFDKYFNADGTKKNDNSEELTELQQKYLEWMNTSQWEAMYQRFPDAVLSQMKDLFSPNKPK